MHFQHGHVQTTISNKYQTQIGLNMLASSQYLFSSPKSAPLPQLSGIMNPCRQPDRSGRINISIHIMTPICIVRPKKILSHNVQRLNPPVKHWKAFQHYYSIGVKSLLLQESHLQASYNPKFLYKQYPQFFFLTRTADKTKGSVSPRIFHTT